MGVNIGIAEFAEKIYGKPLLKCQKELIRKTYELGKAGQLVWIKGRIVLVKNLPTREDE